MKLIVAIDEKNAIGRKGDLLCHLHDDLLRFKSLTMGGAVIMGRKTWLSFPHRPLPGRRNIVITHDASWHDEGAEVAHSLAEAVRMAPEGWIIGGGSIYHQAMESGIVDEIYLTRIHHTFSDADTFFPSLEGFKIVEREEKKADERNEYDYSFDVLRRN